MKYTPHSDAEIRSMLAELGLNALDDLFADIPTEIRERCLLPERPSLTEMEVRAELTRKAAGNRGAREAVCFLGGGCYDSFIPAAVSELLAREEFYTAYTPYQPEISQGILQAIFEYQTCICLLTGLEVSNASLYDGGSALASACALAAEATKKRRILLPKTVAPGSRKIVETYAISGVFEPETIPADAGVTDLAGLAKRLDGSVAAVVIPSPNYFGCLESVAEMVRLVREKSEALILMTVDPVSLAILKTPGEYGADLAVGDGQPLGNPMSYGGPHFGFMAVTNRLLRKIPGRLVGETTDSAGRRAFVLTLQAREQHIRREKAGSNICSNQALNALAALMYLAYVGPQGFRQAAERSHRLALYARTKFLEAGFQLLYDRPFFREFVIKADAPYRLMADALRKWEEKDDGTLLPRTLGGLPLDEGILFAFTEKRTPAEIDRLVASMTAARNGPLGLG